MNKLKKWYNENKDKPLFKAKLLAVFLVFVMIIVQIYADFRDKRENAENNTVAEEVIAEEEENSLAEIAENSKGHVVVFIGLTATLAAVKQKKKQKLKESK